MSNHRDISTVEDLDARLAPLRRQVEDARSKMDGLEGEPLARYEEFVADHEREIRNLESRRRILAHRLGEPEVQPEPEPPPSVSPAPPSQPPAPKPRSERKPTEPKKSTRLFWERQPEETSAQYAAFAAYRDLGITRSIVKAVESVGGSRSKQRRNWETWSSKNMWVARSEAYDAEMERKRRVEREANVVEALERHRKTARMMQSVGLEGLQTYRATGTSEPLLTLLRFVESGLKEERLALGIPTDISQLEHRGGATAEGFEDARRTETFKKAGIALRGGFKG